MKIKLVTAALMAMVLISSAAWAENGALPLPNKAFKSFNKGVKMVYIIKTSSKPKPIGTLTVTRVHDASPKPIGTLTVTRVHDASTDPHKLNVDKSRLSSSQVNIGRVTNMGNVKIGNTPEELLALRRRGVNVQQRIQTGPITGGGQVEIGTTNIDERSRFGGRVDINNDIRIGSIRGGFGSKIEIGVDRL